MDPNKPSKPKDIPTVKANHNSQIDEEEKQKKAGSSFHLSSAISHLDELFIEDFPRRRACSAPLTLEASNVAAKLRLASDSLQSSYEKGKHLKKRRATVTSYRLDAKRRSWPAWNPQIDENAEEGAFQYSASVPSSGTSV